MPETAEDKKSSFERDALPQLDTLYRMALRFTGDASRAQDLVQDTMFKAFRSWHRYEPGTNVRAWLLTILRNTFINDYRREKQRGPTVDIETAETFSLFDEVQEEDPEGQFFDKIVDEEVLRAIDGLPEEFRETLTLSDVEGMSYQEIAGVTGAPVGTVKSRLFRARRALQRKLYDYAVEMGYIKRRKP
jgi:RNA polymerase sigma-70 factor (ECF subfamily)